MLLCSKLQGLFFAPHPLPLPEGEGRGEWADENL